MILVTPSNSRDLSLQTLVPRVLTLRNNYISLVAPKTTFVYGAGNVPLPSTITVTALLAGVLDGVVTFSVVGLLPGTNLTLNPLDQNKLILDPSTFAQSTITITASLTYGGAPYTSAPITISKEYSSIVPRITRSFDNVYARTNGTGYTLPAPNNYIELFNGNTKFTDGSVVYSIEGASVDNFKKQNGLILSVDRDTGLITLTEEGANYWISEYETFTLTATRDSITYSVIYSVTKLRDGVTGARDLTPPPSLKVADVIIATGSSAVFITLKNGFPTYTSGHGHAKTKVYGVKYTAQQATVYNAIGEKLDRSTATLQHEFYGTFGSFYSEPATIWGLWVYYESNDGVLSTTPADEQAGIIAITGQDVTKIVEALTGPGNPFTILERDTVIDGVPYLAGTYTTQSFIIDAQISRAKIADLAVDNAKIDNLSASKLTVGDGTIGNILKSANYAPVDENGLSGQGWILNKNGSAVFGSASIRDKIRAGQIDTKGLTIRDLNDNIILDAGSTLLDQIPPYAAGASNGGILNFDPSCSDPRVWDPSAIVAVTNGITGFYALSGSNGEHLLEGITGNISTNRYTFPVDPNRRYMVSALIRKVGDVLSGTVHLGLLEYDGEGIAQYPWGGYLRGAISALELTEQFTRYYVYFAPGSLAEGAVRAAVHAVMGYPSTNGGSVEIQDLKVEDITHPYNSQKASVSSAAIDATTKVDASATALTQVFNEGLSKKLENAVTNIMQTDFFLQTNGYATSSGATGLAIYDGGIIARKNGIDTFVIGSDGNAIFSGELSIDSGEASRLVCKTDRIEVWNSGVKRVQLGNISTD